MRKLTKKAFREWLEGFRPRQVVGYSSSISLCPVARFGNMKEAGPAMLISKKGSVIDTPRWAARFINKIDHCGVYKIDAARALKILEEC